MKKLKSKDLQILAKTIDKEIKNVNNGGCCIFASLVSERLKDFVDVKINVYSYSNKSIDDVRPDIKSNTLSEWNNKGIFFGHVVTEFKYKNGVKKEFDSTGIHKPDGSICYCYNKTKGNLTLKETKTLAAKKAGWNRCFDRNQIPTMKKIINTFFDGYEPSKTS
jgi:hypothetical protein